MIDNTITRYSQYFKIGSLDEIREKEIFYINNIKKTIIDHFERVGIYFDYQYRTILKGKIDYPMFVSKSHNPGIKEEYIILSIDDYSYWCQVIYQLSHELTHCFIYCNNKDINKNVKWIEETICEAMSLYYLKYFSKYWKDCPLSKINPTYFKSIEQYLDNILKKEGTNKLSNLNNLDDLRRLNEYCEENRADRFNEMKKLYKLIDDDSIKGLLKYKDFVGQDGALDTFKYKAKYLNNKSVTYICNIQENIMNS